MHLGANVTTKEVQSARENKQNFQPEFKVLEFLKATKVTKIHDIFMGFYRITKIALEFFQIFFGVVSTRKKIGKVLEVVERKEEICEF